MQAEVPAAHRRHDSSVIAWSEQKNTALVSRRAFQKSVVQGGTQSRKEPGTFPLHPAPDRVVRGLTTGRGFCCVNRFSFLLERMFWQGRGWFSSISAVLLAHPPFSLFRAETRA